MKKFGLEISVIEQIQAVFSRFYTIDKVLIYGSRAKGNYRYNSDIDLSILGNISYDDLLKIEIQLDDLLLPYKIDLSVFQNVENEDLKNHIERVGQIFYIKNN